MLSSNFPLGRLKYSVLAVCLRALLTSPPGVPHIILPFYILGVFVQYLRRYLLETNYHFLESPKTLAAVAH
jgi:hypothetical protein